MTRPDEYEANYPVGECGVDSCSPSFRILEESLDARDERVAQCKKIAGCLAAGYGGRPLEVIEEVMDGGDTNATKNH